MIKQQNVAPFKIACTKGKELIGDSSDNPRPIFQLAGITISKATAIGIITLSA
jgi:hypothetical protein